MKFHSHQYYFFCINITHFGWVVTYRLYFPEFKEAFDLFDMNGDGHISAVELGKVLQAIGQNPTESTIKEVMKKADKDGQL